MFCIALEAGGCKQLEKIEKEFSVKLWKTLDTLAEVRGGKRTCLEENYFIFFFDAQDSGGARWILDTACEIKEVLTRAQNYLTGFLMLIEFFPGEIQKDAACRELRRLTSVREIDDSLLLGPQGAELFRPYCTIENLGGSFRVKNRIREPGPRLGTAAEFCLRAAVVEEIRTMLCAHIDCAKPPRVFLIHGPPFSGVRYQVNAALKDLDVSPCRIYPLPGRNLPALDFPGFAQIPQVLSAAERKLWQEKKNIFTFTGVMDFPFEEALSAYSLAISAYIRLSERNLAPAVLVCEEFHAMPRIAKKFLALIFRRNLQGWRLLCLCMSREKDLGDEFKSIPTAKYKMPSIGPDEIRFLMGSLSGKQSASSLISVRNSAGGILSLYFEFLTQNAEAAAESLREFQPVMRFLQTQERPLREILCILQETSGLIPSRQLEDFLLKFDFTHAQCRDIIRRLVGLGLIRDEKTLIPVFPELCRFLRKDSELRRKKIYDELAVFFYELGKEKKLGGEPVFLNFFAENRKTAWFTQVFQSYAEALLDAGAAGEARELLDTKFPVLPDAGIRLVTAIAALRLALAQDDAEGAAGAFARLEPAQPGSVFYGLCLIQKTFYWLKRQDRKEALGCAKNAVMLFQGKPGSAGSLSLAHTAVGLAMLAADNPEHAIDYFLMAREAEKTSIRTIFLEGICRFIMGNYSQALENFSRVTEFAVPRFARRWMLAARFMEARILFELGEYQEAGTVFQLLLTEATGLQYSAPAAVVYMWLARSLVYQGETRTAARILDKFPSHPEAVFFRAEADYFRKEYRKARDRLEPFLKFPYAGDCFLGDTPAWKGGFYFAEDICIGRQGGSFLLPNLIRFFYAYLCGLGSEPAAGIEMMSRLVRDEKTSRNDPCIRLYYYWYSRILSDGYNPAFEDRLTVLGRAMQNLQSRTTKMDSPSHKRAFTGKNYWNRLLMADARQNNLV
ncbi:MAG: hypothetical protein LBQ57_01895 [Spirochaetales bacterium]|jgi:tetratricopeptide (TPR) repeat protein|nr:hypothetical protein [Spirochaetales bacterium]